MTDTEKHREGFVVELADGLFLTADMGSTTSLSHARMYDTDRGAGLVLAEAQRRTLRPSSRVISVELTIKRAVAP